MLCIAGSFWLQQINRIADRQEAALEECEAMILKIMGDEYQARGIHLLISTGTVSYLESLSPDYRKYADRCMASLSNA